MAIIGLSGYLKSGKDTVGKMMQWIIAKEKVDNPTIKKMVEEQGYGEMYDYTTMSGWKIKKFAGILKVVTSIMTGISVEKFEDQEFKDSYMPPEWDYDCEEINGQGEYETVRKRMTVREFLVRLGTKAVRHRVHEDAWVIAAMADYKPKIKYVDRMDQGGEEMYPNWIFTDCRFPNEAQAIKDKGGVIVRISREVPGVSQKLIDREETEISLDDWRFDYVINNMGSLDDLVKQVEQVLGKINEINLVSR